MRSPTRKAVSRAALLLGSLVGFSVFAECLYRWLGPQPRDFSELVGGSYWRDENRVEISPAEGVERGIAVPLERSPRLRWRFVPGTFLYSCYRDWRQPWFDDHGCVPWRINRCWLREREEVCDPKPVGQRRIVCIGDSMTAGWGVRAEDCWTRLVEDRLRGSLDDAIRTVNCGLSGALHPDEYPVALENRFAAFEPDVVLVSLCLNDLLHVNAGMSHNRPETVGGEVGTIAPERGEVRAWWTHSRILRDLVVGVRMPDRLRLDPDRDWVQEILDLPDAAYPEDLGRSAYWAGGGPQKALAELRDFCQPRGIAYGVVLWPFFQGLDDDEFYPFAKMHELVAGFCAAEGIAFLDLLPAFRGRSTPTLWVSPVDLHGNVRAQRIATPGIAEFISRLLQG